MQRLAAALEGMPSQSSTAASLQALSGIVWTPSMRRMYTLVDRLAARAMMGSTSPIFERLACMAVCNLSADLGITC